MKKKGFTLIELLAVIVILAIIALIATLLVLKYIEKSRKESKVDSAYSFVRNLETEIANFSIKHNGKKYNGQPTDKGYYELTSFENSEIDTTVKGDKPNSIKVCLSSLGQVDKAMFEYGNYYVSYDGKKGSISDKDAYDNFKCDNDTVVFDGEVVITNKDGAYIFDKCLDQTKFKNNANYRITIGDDEVHDVISAFGKYDGEDGFALTKKYDFFYLYSGNNCILARWDENLTLDDREHIKIEYINDDIYPHYLTIETGELTIFSLELDAGDAIVKIEDNNGNSSTFNVEVKTYDMQGFINIESLSEREILMPYYELVKNGGTVTVTVTQGENVYVLGGSEFTFEDDYYCDGELYYWGNNKLGYWFGC